MHIFRLPQEKSTQSLSLFFSNFCMSHFIFIAIISCAVAFKSNASTPSNYQASKTQNPEIELNELEFALMPLTKDEVEVELNAWLVLLKNKAMIFNYKYGGSSSVASNASATNMSFAPDTLRERPTWLPRSDDLDGRCIGDFIQHNHIREFNLFD